MQKWALRLISHQKKKVSYRAKLQLLGVAEWIFSWPHAYLAFYKRLNENVRERQSYKQEENWAVSQTSKSRIYGQTHTDTDWQFLDAINIILNKNDKFPYYPLVQDVLAIVRTTSILKYKRTDLVEI